MSPDAIKDLLLPTFVLLGKDPIPNIRFNVAKSMEQIAPVLKPTHSAVVNDQVKPMLTKLKEDTDADVRYFATKALAVC